MTTDNDLVKSLAILIRDHNGETWENVADSAIALIAPAIRAQALEEAAAAQREVRDKWLSGLTVKSMKQGFVEAVFNDYDAAIRALIPSEADPASS